MRNIRQWTSERMVIGSTIVDKSTKSIVSRKEYILFGRRRAIPFSEVESINLEHHRGITGVPGGLISIDTWKVCLSCKDYERVQVCSSENKQEQLELASILSNLLGKEIKEMKAGPGFLERFLTSAQEEQDRKKPPSTWSGL